MKGELIKKILKHKTTIAGILAFLIVVVLLIAGMIVGGYIPTIN